MKKKVYIDGSEGTTGLQIHERLSGRADIEMLSIGSASRKDANERCRLIEASDLTFICLPDEAARETARLAEGSGTRIIDASSAHRTADGWTYGLPELSAAQKEKIRTAGKVTNPGCHATGAVLLLAPLVREGLLTPGSFISITSLTGYTGGGKSMIAQYRCPASGRGKEYDAPRLYSTGLRHKHIPEIMRYGGLTAQPAFLPVVADFPQGMQVIIPLALPGKRNGIYDTLAGSYAGCRNIEVTDSGPKFAPANLNACSDKVTLSVLGYDDIIILTAVYDNLGKGASGAAVQNMNIMLGLDEYEGLLLQSG